MPTMDGSVVICPMRKPAADRMEPERFHVHPAFQRQRCEGVAQVMEPDVFRADGLQNFIVGSAEGVWVIHSPGLGRWE